MVHTTEVVHCSSPCTLGGSSSAAPTTSVPWITLVELTTQSRDVWEFQESSFCSQSTWFSASMGNVGLDVCDVNNSVSTRWSLNDASPGPFGGKLQRGTSLIPFSDRPTVASSSFFKNGGSQKQRSCFSDQPTVCLPFKWRQPVTQTVASCNWQSNESHQLQHSSHQMTKMGDFHSRYVFIKLWEKFHFQLFVDMFGYQLVDKFRCNVHTIGSSAIMYSKVQICSTVLMKFTYVQCGVDNVHNPHKLI